MTVVLKAAKLVDMTVVSMVVMMAVLMAVLMAVARVV